MKPGTTPVIYLVSREGPGRRTPARSCRIVSPSEHNQCGLLRTPRGVFLLQVPGRRTLPRLVLLALPTSPDRMFGKEPTFCI